METPRHDGPRPAAGERASNTVWPLSLPGQVALPNSEVVQNLQRGGASILADPEREAVTAAKEEPLLNASW